MIFICLLSAKIKAVVRFPPVMNITLRKITFKIQDKRRDATEKHLLNESRKDLGMGAEQ